VDALDNFAIKLRGNGFENFEIENSFRELRTAQSNDTKQLNDNIGHCFDRCSAVETMLDTRFTQCFRRIGDIGGTITKVLSSVDEFKTDA
jgi:hypothetical protein